MTLILISISIFLNGCGTNNNSDSVIEFDSEDVTWSISDSKSITDESDTATDESDTATNESDTATDESDTATDESDDIVEIAKYSKESIDRTFDGKIDNDIIRASQLLDINFSNYIFDESPESLIYDLLNSRIGLFLAMAMNVDSSIDNESDYEYYMEISNSTDMDLIEYYLSNTNNGRIDGHGYAIYLNKDGSAEFKIDINQLAEHIKYDNNVDDQIELGGEEFYLDSLKENGKELLSDMYDIIETDDGWLASKKYNDTYEISLELDGNSLYLCAKYKNLYKNKVSIENYESLINEAKENKISSIDFMYKDTKLDLIDSVSKLSYKNNTYDNSTDYISIMLNLFKIVYDKVSDNKNILLSVGSYYTGSNGKFIIFPNNVLRHIYREFLETNHDNSFGPTLILKDNNENTVWSLNCNIDVENEKEKSAWISIKFNEDNNNFKIYGLPINKSNSTDIKEKLNSDGFKKIMDLESNEVFIGYADDCQILISFDLNNRLKMVTVSTMKNELKVNSNKLEIK